MDSVELIYAFADSKLFKPWIDPISGIKSYILTRHVAPIQQSFYFTNQSFSADGRYL